MSPNTLKPTPTPTESQSAPPILTEAREIWSSTAPPPPGMFESWGSDEEPYVPELLQERIDRSGSWIANGSSNHSPTGWEEDDTIDQIIDSYRDRPDLEEQLEELLREDERNYESAQQESKSSVKNGKEPARQTMGQDFCFPKVDLPARALSPEYTGTTISLSPRAESQDIGSTVTLSSWSSSGDPSLELLPPEKESTPTALHPLNAVRKEKAHQWNTFIKPKNEEKKRRFKQMVFDHWLARVESRRRLEEDTEYTRERYLKAKAFTHWAAFAREKMEEREKFRMRALADREKGRRREKKEKRRQKVVDVEHGEGSGTFRATPALPATATPPAPPAPPAPVIFSGPGISSSGLLRFVTEPGNRVAVPAGSAGPILVRLDQVTPDQVETMLRAVNPQPSEQEESDEPSLDLLVDEEALRVQSAPQVSRFRTYLQASIPSMWTIGTLMFCYVAIGVYELHFRGHLKLALFQNSARARLGYVLGNVPDEIYRFSWEDRWKFILIEVFAPLGLWGVVAGIRRYFTR